MRSPLAMLLVSLTVPAIADARPITAGVNLGVIQSQQDATADANRTLGLWGRIGFSTSLSAQLEVMRIRSDDSYATADMRTATLILAVDLTRGPVVPMLLVGVGVDRATAPYGVEATGRHVEGGFGVEYRSTAGLSIGGELRIGDRSLDQQDAIQPVDGDVWLYAPSHLSAGEYRQARVTLGIRF